MGFFCTSSLQPCRLSVGNLCVFFGRKLHPKIRVLVVFNPPKKQNKNLAFNIYFNQYFPRIIFLRFREIFREFFCERSHTALNTAPIFLQMKIHDRHHKNMLREFSNKCEINLRGLETKPKFLAKLRGGGRRHDAEKWKLRYVEKLIKLPLLNLHNLKQPENSQPQL